MAKQSCRVEATTSSNLPKDFYELTSEVTTANSIYSIVKLCKSTLRRELGILRKLAVRQAEKFDFRRQT